MNFEDLVAERALLSLLCNNSRMVFDAIEYITGDDFSSETNIIIFKAICSAIEESPDKIDKFLIRNIAINDLSCASYDTLTDNGKYVEALFEQKVSEKNFERFVARIKDLSIKRKLVSALIEIREDISNAEANKTTATNLLVGAEDKITSIVNSINQANEITFLSDNFIELINETADNPKENIGLSSGFPRFDRAIGGGFRRASITLVGARRKNFKSGFVINIGRNIALEGVNNGKTLPVLILDTELQKEYQRFRFGASASRIPINFLETGKWRSNRAFVEAAESASTRMEGAPICHVYTGGYPIEKITSTIKYWLNKHVGRGADGRYKDCLVVYDYIKIMDRDAIRKNEAEWQVLGYHMTALQDLMVKCDIPMLCMAQLNKEEDFAGADRMTWFASNICKLGWKSPEEIQNDGAEAGNMRIGVSCTRFGPGLDDGDFINLKADTASMFVEEGLSNKEVQEKLAAKALAAGDTPNTSRKNVSADDNNDLNSPND
jgi:replicative DNA helicase